MQYVFFVPLARSESIMGFMWDGESNDLKWQTKAKDFFKQLKSLTIAEQPLIVNFALVLLTLK